MTAIEFSTALLPGAPVRSEREPEPCAIVIFGITGDLARRKLMPGLYNLALEGRLPPAFRILGVGRRALAPGALQRMHREATQAFSRTRPLDETVWDRLAGRMEYVAGDYGSRRLFDELGARLDSSVPSDGTGGNRLFYLSTPAEAFAPILDGLQQSGLLAHGSGEQGAPWARLAIEKPFGHDLESARRLNRRLAQFLSESQVFRMDHYLGKETVQNLLVFRFGNPIFEPLWNRKYIDHVQLTAAESIGLEGRGHFYEQTGVVRDILQNHLLQVLSLCTMEAPVSFKADDIRDEKLKLLRSVRAPIGSQVKDLAVLGQYAGYREEPGVSPDSRTPTYAALELSIDNWRWQGVPFYLRAGKGLSRRLTEVAVVFQSIPLCLFGRDEVCQLLRPNVLTLRIQPQEGIQLSFMTKVPGEDLSAAEMTMDFSYERAFGSAVLEAYERLLLDCMRGDGTLFPRRDLTEVAWELMTPLLTAAESDGALSLHAYERGSAGPGAASEMLHRRGRAWRQL